MVTCELGFRIRKDVRRFASFVAQTKILLDVHGQKYLSKQRAHQELTRKRQLWKHLTIINLHDKLC